MLLRLLLVCVALYAARADTPSILTVNTNDPDDNDRTYSNGDAITLFIATSATFSSSRQIANAVQSNGQGVFLPDKAAVDALLEFSVNLGASYTGQWAAFGPMYQLTITVTNVTGADIAQLEAHNVDVTCRPNAIYLVGATASDGPCTSTMRMTATDHWGLGRPHVTSVISASPNSSLLLGAGDTVRIAFDADVDLDQVASYMAANGNLNGSDYVRVLPISPLCPPLPSTALALHCPCPRLTPHKAHAPQGTRASGQVDKVVAAMADVRTRACCLPQVDALFTLPTDELGSEYEGSWLSSTLFELTLLSPPSNYPHVNSGADYSIECAESAPLYLALPAGSTPSPSARCSSTVAVGATGSFGALPEGPYIIAATADDPDDADSSEATLSVGDVVRLTFSAPTSMPDVSCHPVANGTLSCPAATRLFTFTLDDEVRSLGEWNGTWSSASVLVLTLASLPTSGGALPALTDPASRLSVVCSSVGNVTNGITAVALPSGAPTSLACGESSPSLPPVAVGGDVGAPQPSLSSAMADDADDADAVFSDGDTISLTFPLATDRAGAAIGDAISPSEILRLFEFSPPLPPDSVIAAAWSSDAQLNITITTAGTGAAASPPTQVQCRCNLPQSGRCRDDDGIHFSHLHFNSTGELSCNTGFVSLAGDWGLAPGPTLAAVVASDPDDNDIVFSDGDTLSLTFDEPTDLGGFAVGAALSKADIDALFNFAPNIGTDYTGTWATSLGLTITIVDSAGHGLPAIGSTATLSISCHTSTSNTTNAVRIRDAAMRNLPSECISPSPIAGSFGELDPPEIDAALADDPDDADGILSAGDTISIIFGRATDRAGAGNGCSPIAEPRLDQLLSIRLPPHPPSAPAPPPLNLGLSGRWVDCSTLNLTVGTTPSLALTDAANNGLVDGSIQITDGLLITFSGAGGTSGVGVRNPSSPHFPW